jgi:hypothetical protein
MTESAMLFLRVVGAMVAGGGLAFVVVFALAWLEGRARAGIEVPGDDEWREKYAEAMRRYERGRK